jgi:hypothetical protein
MMGIKTEFNPDLALRNIRYFNEGKRKNEECIPAAVEEGKEYDFLKEGQRLYWLHGEIPLVETEGNGVLSKPKASIVIIEATHFIFDGKVYTKGRYEVVKVFRENDKTFEGFARVK